MSTPDRDPFDDLAKLDIPEPDPVVMNAVIAQSRDAFERRQSRAPAQRPGWWTKPFNWMIPTAASAFALTLAVLVVPGLIDTRFDDRSAEQIVADLPAQPDAPTTLSRGDTSSAAPMPVPTPSAPTSDGVRMGAQGPQTQEAAEPLPVEMSEFEGDGVRIQYQLTQNALSLYLPDGPADEPFDSQPLLMGEAAEITAAFALPDIEGFAVQLRVDDAMFWRVYTPVDGTIARDEALTTLVQDAADQAEVEQRLSDS